MQVARSYMVKSNSKKQKEILDELLSADYNKVFRVHGVKVWRFGANEYAEVKWIHPAFGFSEIWNDYGVHMTAEQMTCKIAEG